MEALVKEAVGADVAKSLTYVLDLRVFAEAPTSYAELGADVRPT